MFELEKHIEKRNKIKKGVFRITIEEEEDEENSDNITINNINKSLFY